MGCIGNSYERADAEMFVTGKAEFTADINKEDMLVLEFLRSPHAHAKIQSIDVSQAEKMDGVELVLTGDDLQHLPPFGEETFDESALSRNKVRYVGDEVAAIVAENKHIAEDAINSIDVKYEVMDSVHDPREAAEPDAPIIHENLEEYITVVDISKTLEGNVSARPSIDVGDVDKAFEEADLVVEGEFSGGRPNVVAMEPHGCVADLDEKGHLTMWVSHQTPGLLRTLVGEAIEQPASDLRVIAPEGVGGGFGHKACILPLHVVTAIAARKTRRPVKAILRRDEDFLMGSRPRQYRKGRMAFDEEGNILGYEGEIAVDLGAYSVWGDAVARFVTGFGPAVIGPYKIDNVRMEGLSAYTNGPRAQPFRAFGQPLPTMARESLIDEAAEELGLSPVEIRRRNVIRPDDCPFEQSTGEIYDTCGALETLEKASEAINVEDAYQDPTKGAGLAMTALHSGARHANLDSDTASAIVKVNSDGTASVHVSASDHGQGHRTTLAQICADELGLNLEDIEVLEGDTDVSPEGHGTWGSRTMVTSGPAIKRAAQDASEDLLKIAAHNLEAATEDLEISDKQIHPAGVPDRGLDIATVTQTAYYPALSPLELPDNVDAGGIIGRGKWDAPTETLGADLEGDICPTYETGTQAAIITIDEETGEVTIDDYVSADDCGRAINPRIVHGQIRGAVVQGLGSALTENLIINSETGQVLNPNLMDYHIPSADWAPEVESIIVEEPSTTIPNGARGAGEAPTGPPAATISNAIYNSTSVRISKYPMSREDILLSLKGASKASGNGSTSAASSGEKEGLLKEVKEELREELREEVKEELRKELS